MLDRPVGRAVVPDLGDLEQWKLYNSDTFHFLTLKLLERRVGGKVLGLITLQGWSVFLSIPGCRRCGLAMDRGVSGGACDAQAGA
jgi:hypothetical protein